MGKSKKSNSNDDIFKNLKSFCQKGARTTSPGNIPTGHFVLDFIIQYGQNPTKVDLNKVEGYDPAKTIGIPLGKLVEIFGEEGGGKSSLAYRIAGYAQKLGHEVLWIDVERSFQENLAYINGCDIDRLYLYDKFDFGEEIINNMFISMESGVKVIILDSVANMVPKALMEADTEKEFMGLLPRLLSKSLGKLVTKAEEHGVLLVFINQLREKINQTWGDNRTSPGGHSLHHNASLRLRIDKMNSKDADIYVPDPETEEDMLIGRHSRVSIIKNRFAKPYRESLEVPIYYEAYFPEIEEIAFDTGRQIKLISVYKGVFNWEGLKIEGRKNFIDHIVKEKITNSLIEAIKFKASEDELILPPEIVLYGPEGNDETVVTGK